MHSGGRVRGALLDLRSVELRPAAEAAKAPGSCCDPGGP
jgi:hypothetical protein